MEVLGLEKPLGSGLSLDLLRIGVIFEDFVYPLRVEGNVDEDARLVGSGTAPAMDADSHNHPDLPILAHQRPTIVPLQKQTKKKHIFFFFSVTALAAKHIINSSGNGRNQDCDNLQLLCLQ